MVRLVRFNREPVFNNLFNQFFEGELSNSKDSPAANINETEQAFELNILVPGYKKEQVHIEVEENILTISAEVEVLENDQAWKKEFELGSFSRSFRLPKNVDQERIKAEQVDGILKVSIPKLKEEQKLKKLIAIS